MTGLTRIWNGMGWRGYILIYPGLRDDWTNKDLEWDGEDIFWFIQVTDLHISKYVHLEIKVSREKL